MPLSCRELGCRFKNYDYPDCILLVCLDCGHEERLAKRNGEHDKFKEAELCKRDLIQPHNYDKWEKLQKHEEIIHFEERQKLKEREEYLKVTRD